jgi:LPXTG-motif cell wall-anchored protein
MRKILTIMLAMALLAALPGGAIAQDNSGLDAYTENPPSAGGDGGGDGTSSGAGTGTGTAAGFASGAGSGVAGTGAGASGSGLTEAQAAAAGVGPNGQLPATGLDATLAMAIVGFAMLAGGTLLFRFVRRPV